MKLNEFLPGDFRGDKPSGKSVLDTVADYLKSKSIECSIDKSRSGFQGYVRFKIRNNNKLLNKFDTFQVETNTDVGFIEYSMVQRNPSKVIDSGRFPSDTVNVNKKIIDKVIPGLDKLLKGRE